ncbi:thioredoxin fold domain-containing protein [Pusillimonas sp. TS35]|nr:thioredoxin fold domain-containing protein [Pusillimonas sp. TS35]
MHAAALLVAATFGLSFWGVPAAAQQADQQPVQAGAAEGNGAATAAQAQSDKTASSHADALKGAVDAAQPGAAKPEQAGDARAAPAQSAQSGQAVPSGISVPERAAPAQADSQVALDGVKKAFEKRFPEVDVGGVAGTPFAGLYEIRLGNDLVYVDRDVNYIMQGTLIDAQRRLDLTAERLEALSKVPFASLPFELAVKIVKGDGSRKMAIFEDPNCPYCKRLHETLKGVDNITIYSFMFPILSPDSTEKVRNVWCAKDKAGTWMAWMVDGKVPAKAECDAPIEQMLALGRKLMVQGTPAIFFSDGSRINGAVPLETLTKKLDAQKG